MTTEDALVFWTAALTITTFLLAIIAVFQEKIKHYFYKPKLNCIINVQIPDCHLLKSHHTYFFRFRIENNGNVSARNVEVIIKDMKNIKNNLIGLSQDNLLWSSHILEADTNIKVRMYRDYISPHTYQYCNLGFIRNPLYNHNYFDTRTHTESVFALEVYWKTPDFKYVLKPGVYYFTIVIGSENAKPITKEYQIAFQDFWSEDENTMLKRISISEVN